MESERRFTTLPGRREHRRRDCRSLRRAVQAGALHRDDQPRRLREDRRDFGRTSCTTAGRPIAVNREGGGLVLEDRADALHARLELPEHGEGPASPRADRARRAPVGFSAEMAVRRDRWEGRSRTVERSLPPVGLSLVDQPRSTRPRSPRWRSAGSRARSRCSRPRAFVGAVVAMWPFRARRWRRGRPIPRPTFWSTRFRRGCQAGPRSTLRWRSRRRALACGSAPWHRRR